MSSSESNVSSLQLSSSSENRGSSPNIDIQRRSPSKLRLPVLNPDNGWQLVGRAKRSPASPASRSQPPFNIASPEEFPNLPVSAHSVSRSPSPDDPFEGSVQVALR